MSALPLWPVLLATGSGAAVLLINYIQSRRFDKKWSINEENEHQAAELSPDEAISQEDSLTDRIRSLQESLPSNNIASKNYNPVDSLKIGGDAGATTLKAVWAELNPGQQDTDQYLIAKNQLSRVQARYVVAKGPFPTTVVAVPRKKLRNIGKATSRSK